MRFSNPFENMVEIFCKSNILSGCTTFYIPGMGGMPGIWGAAFTKRGWSS